MQTGDTWTSLRNQLGRSWGTSSLLQLIRRSTSLTPGKCVALYLHRCHACLGCLADNADPGGFFFLHFYIFGSPFETEGLLCTYKGTPACHCAFHWVFVKARLCLCLLCPVFTVWVHCGWVFPCLRSTLLCFSIKRSFDILIRRSTSLTPGKCVALYLHRCHACLGCLADNADPGGFFFLHFYIFGSPFETEGLLCTYKGTPACHCAFHWVFVKARLCLCLLCPVFTVWVHCGWVFPCLRSTLLCFSIKRSFGILMWFAIGLCCFQCFIIIEDFHILM